MGWSPIPGGESNGTRGQSSTLAIALIFGITVLGVAAIITFGSAAITDTQHASEVSQAEQSMTQFDSQTAEVALGDSDTQSIRLGRNGGSYHVEDTGTLTVTHVDYDGPGTEVDLYTGNLGTVVYENGNSEIGYQGGGVWRLESGGRSRMVSPPEFHYRDGTLTLPVIKAIRGSGSSSVSGSTVANVKPSTNAYTQHYPNAGKPYPGGGKYYLNPVSMGHIQVKVQSRYAYAWKEFFESRTDGETTYDDNGTPGDPSDDAVTLELQTLGPQGAFEMPSDDKVAGGGKLEVRGYDTSDHALGDLHFTLYSDEKSSSKFKNLQWGLWAESGSSKRLEIAVAGTFDCNTDKIPIHIYYTDDNHATYQGWKTTIGDGFDVQCVDYDGDSDDEAKATIDLSGTLGSPQSVEYAKIQSSEVQKYTNKVNQNNYQQSPPPAFTHHPADPGTSYTLGDTEPLPFIISHYFALMGPNFDLKVDDQQGGNGAGVNEDESAGVIRYTGGDNVVTYLHITENGVEIDLRSR